MFEITEAAQEQIADFFKEKEVKPIRIFLYDGGCSGPQIAMGLDEKRENDTIYDVAGIEYVIDKDFLEKAQPISVDFGDMGFSITSPLELGGGCGCDSHNSGGCGGGHSHGGGCGGGCSC